ncbi:MAG: hypothetical protein H7223_00165 [Pedobacter sp.]|nr:hypothetical protein [Pedobacter sp.]
MEPFEILITINGNDHALLAVPFPDEIKYKIFNGLDQLCAVWPFVENEQVTWMTDKDVEIELLVMIGNGIEKAINYQLAANQENS